MMELAKKSAQADLVQRLVLTILAQDIFTKRFQHKREEWRMIGRNVQRWLLSAKEDLKNAGDQDLEQKVTQLEATIKGMDYTVMI